MEILEDGILPAFIVDRFGGRIDCSVMVDRPVYHIIYEPRSVPALKDIVVVAKEFFEGRSYVVEELKCRDRDCFECQVYPDGKPKQFVVVLIYAPFQRIGQKAADAIRVDFHY